MVPDRRDAAAGMGGEIRLQPAPLPRSRAAADDVAVRVQDVDPPRPEVVRVPALAARAGARAEVAEVAGGTRGLPVVVTQRRARPIHEETNAGRLTLASPSVYAFETRSMLMVVLTRRDPVHGVGGSSSRRNGARHVLWAVAALRRCSYGLRSSSNKGAPCFTVSPSVKRILSTNPSMRARTWTFWGESSCPMISVNMAAFVPPIWSTCTVGGEGGAVSCFLQETLVSRTATPATPAARERALHEQAMANESLCFIRVNLFGPQPEPS